MQQFQFCMSALENVTDTGLTFATSKAELDRMCPDMKKAVRCIHHYTRSCWSFERHRHFDKMFRNTARMIHELCTNEHYQTVYLEHSMCMSKATTDHTICLKRYTKVMEELHSTEPDTPVDGPISKKRREVSDERIQRICCAFQHYVDCSSHSMRRKCGETAATFSAEFIRNMSSTMITDYCTMYGPEECGVYSSANQITFSLLLGLLSVIALFLS
ncbi:hypothetical protein Trydic_g3145 [Trypoxylus dichotomus]